MKFNVNLKSLCDLAGLTPKVILETGVGPHLECEELLSTAKEVILVDPIEVTLKKQEGRWNKKEWGKLTLHNTALGREAGETVIHYHPAVDRGVPRGNSIVTEAKPLLPRYRSARGRMRRWKSMKVPVATLGSIDKGKIDLAVIDVEGVEAAVLSTMVSRPKIIMVEVGAAPKTRRVRSVHKVLLDKGYTLAIQGGRDRYYVSL